MLQELSRHDPAVQPLANHANYGPEPSAVNALEQARRCDLLVLLCSDLQDPPELVIPMVRALLAGPGLDAVMAVKKQSAGGPMLRLARRIYYKVLGYSSRLQRVPSGFHGFGCYRREVVEEALRYWDNTDLNLRQCLANASKSPLMMDYLQAERQRGVSSYRAWSYWQEALRSLLSADAAASRLALLIGCGGLLLAVLMAGLLLVNFLSGNSGYGGGIPTVMGLVLISFALQMLMFAMLSRQLESLRMGGFRPKVRFRVLDVDSSLQ